MELIANDMTAAAAAAGDTRQFVESSLQMVVHCPF